MLLEPPRTVQDAILTPRDPRGAPRASQGPPWDPPRTPQEAPPGPPRTPQKALGPFQDLPRTPKYPPRDPSGAPNQGLSGTSLGPSQMPQDAPPRPPRTPETPLEPPQDLKHPLQELSEPCSSPQDLFQDRPGPPKQGQNLFMTPQATSLQPPSLQRPRRDSRSDNNYVRGKRGQGGPPRTIPARSFVRPLGAPRPFLTLQKNL